MLEITLLHMNKRTNTFNYFYKNKTLVKPLIEIIKARADEHEKYSGRNSTSGKVNL